MGIDQTSTAQLEQIQRLAGFHDQGLVGFKPYGVMDFVFSWSKVECDSFTASGFRGKACFLGPGFKVRMYSYG